MFAFFVFVCAKIFAKVTAESLLIKETFFSFATQNERLIVGG